MTQYTTVWKSENVFACLISTGKRWRKELSEEQTNDKSKEDLRSALRLLKRHRDALPHLIQGEVPFSITAMRKREVI